MLPDNELSAVAVASDFIVPRTTPLQDFEWGGVAIGDSSLGRRFQVWRAYYDAGGIYVVADNQLSPQLILSAANVTEIDIAFDQNMRPVIAYVANDLPYLYWYDPLAAAQVTTALHTSVKNPRVSLDDVRDSQIASSDIILAYIKNNQLCMRVQRERYLIEHILVVDLPRPRLMLRQIGMSAGLRFQFLLQ